MGGLIRDADGARDPPPTLENALQAEAEVPGCAPDKGAVLVGPHLRGAALQPGTAEEFHGEVAGPRARLFSGDDAVGAPLGVDLEKARTARGSGFLSQPSRSRD
eukprot:6796297-Pyramimonas_sp.AAC.1